MLSRSSHEIQSLEFRAATGSTTGVICRYAVVGILAFAAIFSGSTFACGQALERELVIRTEADKETITGLARLFEAKYPGTRVIATTMGSSEIVIRTFREMPSPQADVLTTKHFMLMQAVEDSRRQQGESMLVAYRPKGLERLDPRLIDKDGYWFTERWAARAIVYHDEAAKKFGELKCFRDLMTWKGKFEYADPITQGSGFSAVLAMIQDFGGWERPEGGIRFAAELEKAQRMNHPATETMLQMFSRGETDAHWNFDSYHYRLLKRGIASRAVYPCEGTIYDANAVSIVRNAKNPNAAKAWVDFVLSREAQEWLMATTFFRTAGFDVTPPPEMANKIPNEEAIRFDIPWDVVGARSNEYKQLWESQVQR
jgi:ABC-type Fe3+ transport system substrate-binding protein